MMKFQATGVILGVNWYLIVLFVIKVFEFLVFNYRFPSLYRRSNSIK